MNPLTKVEIAEMRAKAARPIIVAPPECYEGCEDPDCLYTHSAQLGPSDPVIIRLLDELERTREAVQGMHCGSYGFSVSTCIARGWCDCPAREVLPPEDTTT